MASGSLKSNCIFLTFIFFFNVFLSPPIVLQTNETNDGAKAAWACLQNPVKTSYTCIHTYLQYDQIKISWADVDLFARDVCE